MSKNKKDSIDAWLATCEEKLLLPHERVYDMVMQAATLAHQQDNPSLLATARSLSAHLKVSIRAIRDQLDKLETSGLVRRIGKTPIRFVPN